MWVIQNFLKEFPPNSLGKHNVPARAEQRFMMENPEANRLSSTSRLALHFLASKEGVGSNSASWATTAVLLICFIEVSSDRIGTRRDKGGEGDFQKALVFLLTEEAGQFSHLFFQNGHFLTKQAVKGFLVRRRKTLEKVGFSFRWCILPIDVPFAVHVTSYCLCCTQVFHSSLSI